MSKTFKFFKGKENTVIVEKQNFSDSIFFEQYNIAFKLLNDLIDHPLKGIPNLIAFCGDRGEGKTSCLETVRNILLFSKDINNEQLKSIGADKEKYKYDGLEVLELIDPAFFDKEHNLIELLLGHLYGGYKKWMDNNRGKYNYEDANNVSKQFQRAKMCLRHLTQSQIDMYDPIQELDALSAGVELSECISSLIKQYLKLIGKKRLVVSIDDIDLNMSRAYRMCEELRKYLNNDQCIILISVKIEQLTEAVENAIHKDADFPNGMDFSGMAAKYVSKLIPIPMRVEMPKAYDLCDYELEVYSSEDNKLKFQSRSVKEGVVRRIFNTCRFLFYNSKGAVSRIVPNNLRSLSHLLGLLFSMEEYHGNKDILLKNKHIFKSYFYKSWVRQLSPQNQVFIKKLTEGQDGNDTNKYVVNYLRKYLIDTNANNGMYQEITDPSNYGYNVSVGDVLYIVSYLERSSFDEELQSVLFFIKAYYSIILYEKYDDITDAKDIKLSIYPETNIDGNLYRADAWFNNTNPLQRFISGGYFTYQPDELLPPKGRGASSQSRDFKFIQGGDNGLTGLFSNLNFLMPHYEELTPEDKEAFENKFKLAEYFALCTVQSTYGKEIRSTAKVIRQQQTPYYLTPFNTNTGFYIFDILAPFTSLANAKYAYKRFSDLSDIYDFAMDHEWSLIRQIISKVRNKNLSENDNSYEAEKEYPTFDSDQNNAIWRMYSNSIIRNSEVALAMMDNIKSKRFSYRDYNTDTDLVCLLYEQIMSSNMMTYNRSEKEKPYYINFEFLKPITELLKDAKTEIKCTIHFNDKKYSLASFSNIYDFNPLFKANITNKMVEEMFAETLKSYKESTGEVVLALIAQRQEYLYMAMKETTWETLFDKEKKYKKADFINTIKPIYNELIEAYQEHTTSNMDNNNNSYSLW